MHILKQPQFIIALLSAVLVLLAAFGVYFTIKCARASSEKKAGDYLSVSKLENLFYKLMRRKENRCVLYISIYLDNAMELYPEVKVWHLYNEIKEVLLKVFSEIADGGIAPYEKRNFIVVNRKNLESVKIDVDNAIAGVKQRILNYDMAGVADIKIGAFCTPGDSINFDAAINRAKEACGDAEDRGHGYVEWNRGAELQKRVKRESGIEKEIDENRFFFEYQPVVDAKTKKITSAEVFSRLNSESDGIIMPIDFLDAVRSMALNEKFDHYVFDKLCKWISNDKEKRTRCEYAVNFSRTTLASLDFVKRIVTTVEKYGLKPGCFAIEILEDKSNSEESVERMRKNLAEIRSIGMRILIDDYGSGYTSFSDLQGLTVDTMKIDRSLIKNAETETGRVIFKNIVRTAKDIGLKTVCEGIETEEQEQIAIEAGCDMLQGFYYYRPLSVKQFEKLYNEQNQ